MKFLKSIIKKAVAPEIQRLEDKINNLSLFLRDLQDDNKFMSERMDNLLDEIKKDLKDPDVLEDVFDWSKAVDRVVDNAFEEISGSTLTVTID